MRSCRLASLALAAAAAGCATTGEPGAAQPGPPPFEGVKSLVLVRWTDDPAGRPKDPLDALEESLGTRGYRARVVDVGGRTPPELRGVERLHARLGARIHGAGGRDRFARRVEDLGRDAGDVVAALGVDAVALYHRFDGRPLPGAFDDPPPLAGIYPSAPTLVGRPLGALSLVDRAGNAIWFDWGAPGADLDPEVPANAAEAIDALLAVLSGDGGEP